MLPDGPLGVGAGIDGTLYPLRQGCSSDAAQLTAPLGPVGRGGFPNSPGCWQWGRVGMALPPRHPGVGKPLPAPAHGAGQSTGSWRQRCRRASTACARTSEFARVPSHACVCAFWARRVHTQHTCARLATCAPTCARTRTLQSNAHWVCKGSMGKEP